MSALEQLAEDPARFIESVFNKRPEITVTGRDHSLLGSLDGFDYMINETLLPAAAFRIVRDGESAPVSSYTREFGGRRGSAIRVADPALVFDWFGAGATIVLEGLHRYSPGLREFARDLEEDLGHRVQINAYITPEEAQGFATHVDTHDVFVVQLHGRKRWQIFSDDDQEGTADPLIDRDLETGDCLYIPKGFPHSATTGSSASVHLTIGVHVRTWADLKREVTALIDISDERPVDVRGLNPDDVPALSERLLEEVRDEIASLNRDDLTHRLTRLLFTSKHHTLRGQLNRIIDATEINDSSEVVTRVEWRRYNDGDEAVLVLPDRELRFSARLRPALDIVLRKEPFLVADLKPELDEQDRRDVVTRLIREGLLERR